MRPLLPPPLFPALLVSLLSLPPGPAWPAEPPPSGLEELRLLQEETVSIAVGHEQPISEAPSNVYVITDEDIRHSGAPDIPTILRRIPGLEVMQMTGADFNVSARGDNEPQANKMLVMVDGRSIYIDAQGIVYWKNLPVTLPEIKRIEVLKGPVSALYGFNAFDGIINIITKSPEEMKGTTLQFGGGEFGTLTSSAIQAGIHGKLGYRLSLGRDQTNQWRARDSLAFRSHKFNVHTEYRLAEEAKLLLSGGLVDANRFDGPIRGISTPADTPSQGYANLAYERPNFFVRAWWTGWYNSTEVISHPLLQPGPILQSTNRDLGRFNKTRANTYDLEIQRAVAVGEAHRLAYGINYRNNILSSTFIAAASREERLGFYVQDEWKVAQRTTVVAGVRYDLHTEINGTFSPRVALLYRPAPDHTFRASMSVAYRPPTLIETNLDVRTTVPPFPPGTVVSSTSGSHNLDPEEIVSYEAGYQGWFLRHRLRARANLFFNHLSELIVLDTPTSRNGAEADIYGGEAGVEFLATRWLTGFANYSYQEAGQRFTGSALRGVPRYKFNLGLRGEWETGLSAEAAFHYYGAATYPIDAPFTTLSPPLNPRVGSYNLLNLRGGYRFWHEKAEVAVSAFNALNDRHKEHPLGDLIGSRVMGWLTIKY